jgi:hypothetical protein
MTKFIRWESYLPIKACAKMGSSLTESKVSHTTLFLLSRVLDVNTKTAASVTKFIPSRALNGYNEFSGWVREWGRCGRECIMNLIPHS